MSCKNAPTHTHVPAGYRIKSMKTQLPPISPTRKCMACGQEKLWVAKWGPIGTFG